MQITEGKFDNKNKLIYNYEPTAGGTALGLQSAAYGRHTELPLSESSQGAA